MSAKTGWLPWRPTPVGTLATVLVGGGVALADAVNWWFLLLTAAGAFGPGLLRELGLLRDQDEFQRRAAQRAGYHAYLATGFVSFTLYAFTRSGHVFARPEELSAVFFSVLTFTWIFSSLFAFWGPRRAAFVILLVFGTAWGVFNVVGNLAHPVVMLMQLLYTTAPFFVLAFASRRWPRFAGALLTLAALGLLVWDFLLHPHQNLPLLTQIGVAVLFVGPPLASGLALAGSSESDDRGTEPEGAAAGAIVPPV